MLYKISSLTYCHRNLFLKLALSKINIKGTIMNEDDKYIDAAINFLTAARYMTEDKDKDDKLVKIISELHLIKEN